MSGYNPLMAVVDLSRAARKAQTREAIIEAATRLFASKGIEATSIDDIARELGLSRGAVYAHFGSRQGLVDAVSIETSDTVDEEILFRAGLSLKDRLRLLAASLTPYTRRLTPEKVFLDVEFYLYDLRHQGPEYPLSDAQARANEEMGERLEEVARQRGETLPMPGRELAAALLGVARGVGQEIARDPTSITPETVERLFVALAGE